MYCMAARGGEPHADVRLLPARVCRAWRRVALGSPRLWSNIYIDEDHGMYWLPTVLERSAQVPIKLGFDLIRAYDDPEPSLIQTHLRHIEVLDLPFREDVEIQAYLAELMGPAPRLRELTLSSEECLDDAESELGVPSSLVQNVVKITLSNFPPCGFPPFPCLRDATLHHRCGDEPLATLLRLAPLLRHLTLIGVHKGGLFDGLSRVSINHLASFKFLDLHDLTCLPALMATCDTSPIELLAAYQSNTNYRVDSRQCDAIVSLFDTLPGPVTYTLTCSSTRCSMTTSYYDCRVRGVSKLKVRNVFARYWGPTFLRILWFTHAGLSKLRIDSDSWALLAERAKHGGGALPALTLLALDVPYHDSLEALLELESNNGVSAPVLREVRIIRSNTKPRRGERRPMQLDARDVLRAVENMLVRGAGKIGVLSVQRITLYMLSGRAEAQLGNWFQKWPPLLVQVCALSILRQYLLTRRTGWR